MIQRVLILSILILLIVICGCSGSSGSDPVEPVTPSAEAASSGHNLWGLWQFIADPAAQSLDVVKLRDADMHLNALRFLEPPALVYLTLETLQFNGNLITADIGLRHPFLGLTEFTGFDVCGIFITNGSVSGFADSGLVMAGEGDTRLLNPDGYTRWWNSAEFPVNDGTIFSYNDGLLGTPDSIGDFNCTLNAYKYFTDDLDPGADYLSTNPSNRNLFSAGQKNVRTYEIELGNDGLVFNYAVDACWQFPAGAPPWNAPDDFAPAANRVEAWGLSVEEINNTLWYDDTSSSGGGSLSIDVYVYDHFNAALNTVRIEAPGLFPSQESAMPGGGTSEYSVYTFDVSDVEPSFNGDALMLVTVESEAEGYQELLPGETTSAYFTHTVEVSDEPPMNSGWADPVLIDDDARMPRLVQNNNGALATAYHKDAAGIYYSVNGGASWSSPELAYATDPNFMHIIKGESGDTTYIAYYGTGAQGIDRHGLRYQGNPGAWDYMWLWGYTDQVSLILPDGDGSYTHAYVYTAEPSYTGKMWIIRFASWGSDWGYMVGGDEETVRMGSTSAIAHSSTQHIVGYYRDDYARVIHIPNTDEVTTVWYTIYACQAGEDVDSTALAQESDGTLHAVYRVTDSSGYRIEYKNSANYGQNWSGASVIYDGNEQPLMDYVNIAVDDSGNLYAVYAGSKWMYWTYSTDDGLNWAIPEYIFYIDPPPISVHHTQPYLICTGDMLHLVFLDKNTVSTHGMLKYTFMDLN